MENLSNNLRDSVAQFEGIELRRPQNLYMHLPNANPNPEVYTKYSKIKHQKTPKY